MANARCIWRNGAARRTREAKMWRGLVIALVMTAACVGARADELPAHPEALHACVAEAAGDRAALERCRGVVAYPCIEAEGPATMSYVLCWSAESDAWNDVVARASTQLNERWPTKDPMRLARANEAWAAWLEAECEYWAWEEGGGSGEQVERVQCAARVTADRAIALIEASAR
jgi:uncharacterized protein YecT (DUF1311 family)